MTPTERRLRAQVAAYTRWSRVDDPPSATAAARAAFERRFLDEVDPDRSMPEDERYRRAEQARKAYFTRLSLKAAQARRKDKSPPSSASRYSLSAARGLGWNVTNGGEAKIALAFQRLGLGAAAVAQQFRVGSYVLDFAMPEHRICVEADGWVHTTADVRARDRRRDAQLKSWGWRVIRLDTALPEAALDVRLGELIAEAAE